MFNRAIPSQDETDFTDPEQHFMWALRGLPMLAGSGLLTHSSFLRLWSKHLWESGCAHRDYLESLADEEGNIHVSQLPEQKIRFQEAFRGPHHQYNPAARWVRANEPDPEPVEVPNIRDMTIQEQYVMAAQLKAAGVEIPDPPEAPKAEVVEGSYMPTSEDVLEQEEVDADE
jgi:hypothetical protein